MDNSRAHNGEMVIPNLLSFQDDKKCFMLSIIGALMIEYMRAWAGNNTTSNGSDTTGQEVGVDITRVLPTNFSGFGTQYNQNLYAAISATDGITTSNVGRLEV